MAKGVSVSETLCDTLERIPLHKPRLLGRYISFDFGNIPLLQSPLMYMPYAPLYDDYGNMSMDLCLYNRNNNGNYGLFSTIERIYTSAQTRISTHSQYLHLQTYTWVPIVRCEEGGYAQRLKVYAFDANIVAFDSVCKSMNHKHIRRDDRIRVLIRFKHLLADTTTKTVRIKLEIVQIQSMEPVVNEYIFADPIQQASESTLLTIYQKMLKNGISKDAVAHKMKLDGCTANMIELTLKEKQLVSAITSPQPNGMAGLLASLKTGGLKNTLLRPINTENDNKVTLSKIGPAPPSLADILTTLRTLKKTTRC